MSSYTQDELDGARKFINSMMAENGGITKEDQVFMERERPGVLKSLSNVRRKLGAATKILAQELYQKPTLFVYELIQNAEDNLYTITTEAPWVSFTVKQDRVIIDSNEDGFKEENIKAICSIGESTKSSMQGYIGEKGIGFKSVFKIAHKVHIQSGPYSFAFEYNKDDSDNGLGMVTPLNEPRSELPDGVRTRLILYLDESCDRAALQQELAELPNTLLIFLKKLKRLTIRFEVQDTKEIHFSLDSVTATKITVQIQEVDDKQPTVITRKRFWVTKRQVKDMPTDSARRGVHESEVVLAFPVDIDDDIPIVEDQHVFAFLPLRKVGFKFLIQSDFITNANREDVADSAWNRTLRHEVAAAFRNAFVTFNMHSKLQYSWVRYMPITSVADDFWGLLQTDLYNLFRSVEVFYALDGTLRAPIHLRVLAANRYCDVYGAPLLPDLTSGDSSYISKFYDNDLDVPILKSLGARDLNDREFLDRLEADLGHDVDTNSVTKSEDALGEWHAQVAHVLSSIADNSTSKKRITKLKIIPLDDGKWVHLFNASIFLPMSGGLDIPSALDLNLVRKDAIQNPARKALFLKLGLTECLPETVLRLVLQRYLKPTSIPVLTWEQDIRFVFWHNAKLLDKREVPLITTNMDNIAVHRTKSYILFNGSIPSELKRHIRYPVESLYDTLQSCGDRNNFTGITWLQFLGVRETPQLCQRAIQGAHEKPLISAELKYIAKYLPRFLLGVLKADWENYHDSIEWDTFFKETRVPILQSTQMINLEETYLPLPRLKDIVSRLKLENSFGFLAEMDGISDFLGLSGWVFLQHFGVGVNENVSFWLTLLSKAQLQDIPDSPVVFEIYSRLQRYIDREETEQIKEAFGSEKAMVLVPSADHEKAWRWSNLKDCVWTGPEWLTCVDCLQSINGYITLSGLFVTVLGLVNATPQHVLLQLLVIKRRGKEKPKASLLYDKLNELTNSGTNGETKSVQTYIEKHELVYYPKTKSWHHPISCIWASNDIQLPERISIADEYTEQQTFFKNVLGIRKPDLTLHIQGLKRRTQINPQKAAILQDLKNICVLRPTVEKLQTELSGCKFLPARKPSGQIEWMTSKGKFAIIDRNEHCVLFRDRVTMLDFDLEEIHSIHPILSALRLESKYTSRSIKEQTKLQGGVLDAHLTKDLRSKAYAICRYAAHHGVGEIANVFSLLQALEVFTSDSITKEVSIIWNNRTISVPGDTAYLHISQEADQLKIYVPNEKRKREFCLSRQLPIRLLQHLGVSDPTKGSVLGPVITASSLYAVDLLLDADGIIKVPGISPPENYDEGDSSSSTDAPPEDTPGLKDVASSQTAPRITTLSRHIRIEDVDSSDFPSNPIHLPRPVTSGPTPNDRPDLYKNVLDAVIKQARSLEGIPAAGDILTAHLPVGIAIEIGPAIDSAVSGEPLLKIGAAGELFMYEVLKNLALPQFALGNWMSNIRDRVTIHDEYKEMRGWTGSETADIVYKDQDRKLTEMLLTNNYFRISTRPSDPLIGTSPTYYIEVKATLGQLSNPFFCSQPQIDMMERMQLQMDRPVNEIYIIARVFRLGGSGMGLKLYVDPAGLRSNGTLRFTADKYTITPGMTVS